MKLIIGLGNPGDKYQATRHNLGFMVVDAFAKKHLGPEIIWENSNKFKAEILKVLPKVLLVKPQTYMNNSGLAVSKLAEFFKVALEDMIVVHDDLDLPLGKIKVRCGGSGAGHHGVESIMEKLGQDNFIRIRLGIGNLKTVSGEKGGQHFDASSFVTKRFVSNEKPKVKHMLKQTLDGLEILLSKGLIEAQNQYN